MNDLFQLIVEEKNLKILEKALSMLDHAYTTTGIENEDSITTKKLLSITRTTKHLFDNTEIISGFSVNSSFPELFHKGCATPLEKTNNNSDHITFLPILGKLKHMCHKEDFSLQYLECEKCKKVFRITPE